MAMVPDLLRLKNIPANFEQKLETTLTETSTFQEATDDQEGVCRFDLQRKGFLHSHSKLFVSLQPPAGQASACFPLSIGIDKVIKKASLKIGNNVVNEISNWNSMRMITSTHIDNENNVEREYYTSGRCINHKYLFRQSIAGNANSTSQSGFQAPLYGIDNGREYDDNADNADHGNNGGGEGRAGLSMPFAEMLGGLGSECPTYSIDLSDLFPFLRTHSLPLYMIDQPVFIELTFERLNKRVALPTAANGALANQRYPIDHNELKMCIDYIHYSGDAMARYRDANPVIEFSFPDYRLARFSSTAAALGTLQVRNLGMANRLVSRVMTEIEAPLANQIGILGSEVMASPVAGANVASNAGTFEYNIKYNDKFQFPLSITNKAQLFSHTTRSVGVPFVTRQEYSGDNAGLSNFYYNRVTQNSVGTGLRGSFFNFGTRLTEGRVGQKGIELHIKASGYDANGGRDYIVKTWCEYMRLARLDNGLFTIYNA